MTAVVEQPRDDLGRFATYVRPPVPPARPRPAVVLPTAPPADRPPIRHLIDSVPTSVVAVCCPECVYGDPS